MTIFKNSSSNDIKFYIVENFDSPTKHKKLGTKVPKGEEIEINLNNKVGIVFLVLDEASAIYPFPTSTKDVIFEPGKVIFDGISLPKVGSSFEVKSSTDASSASSYRWWMYFIIAAVIIFILYFGLGKKRIK